MEIVNEKKAEILRLLDDSQLSIYEIADKVGIAYSTAHQHIVTLVDNGFVSRVNEDRWKRTGAGTKFLQAIDEGKKEKNRGVKNANKKG